MTTLTKEVLTNALTRRAVTPLLLEELIYELHKGESYPEPTDEAAADAHALIVEAEAASITNGGLSSQVDYLMKTLGSVDDVALALNDFLRLPVVFH